MALSMRMFLWAALITLPLAAGCEEKVVGVRNDWSGSQLNRVMPPEEEPDATDEFFDDTGEALFGWTRHITGEKKKAKPQPRVKEVPLEDRMGK